MGGDGNTIFVICYKTRLGLLLVIPTDMGYYKSFNRKEQDACHAQIATCSSKRLGF